jgi:hypothetical protein
MARVKEKSGVWKSLTFPRGARILRAFSNAEFSRALHSAHTLAQNQPTTLTKIQCVRSTSTAHLFPSWSFSMSKLHPYFQLEITARAIFATVLFIHVFSSISRGDESEVLDSPWMQKCHARIIRRSDRSLRWAARCHLPRV